MHPQRSNIDAHITLEISLTPGAVVVMLALIALLAHLTRRHDTRVWLSGIVHLLTRHRINEPPSGRGHHSAPSDSKG